MTGALACAAALAPRPSHAAVGEPSTAPRALDNVGGAAPAAQEAAPSDSAARPPWHHQPRFVMARSLLIPGWGQVYNRAWLKAGLVAGTEGWLGARIMQDQRELDRLLGELEDARRALDQQREARLVNEYNARLDQRLGRQWLFAGALAYALVDAYVDAHFHGFDVEFENDPALPAGKSPAARVGGGGSPGVRLSLRWNF